MSHGETVRYSAGRASRWVSTTELHHLSFVPSRLHSSPTECTQYQLMRCRLTKDSLAGFSAKRTASAGRSLTSTTGRLSRWYRGCFLQPDRLSIANAAAPHSYAAVTKRFPDISAVDISLAASYTRGHCLSSVIHQKPGSMDIYKTLHYTPPSKSPRSPRWLPHRECRPHPAPTNNC